MVVARVFFGIFWSEAAATQGQHRRQLLKATPTLQQPRVALWQSRLVGTFLVLFLLWYPLPSFGTHML